MTTPRADRCPRCNGDHVEGGSVDVNEQGAEQECYCRTCGAEFILRFKLYAVDVLDPPERPPIER